MIMFEPSLLSIGLSLVFTVMGWFLRELWSSTKKLAETVSNLKDKLTTEYARKEEVRDFRNEILSHLIRIENKLDMKADRHGHQ
jgi:hypothetical protein